MERKMGKLLEKLMEIYEEAVHNDYMCKLDADGVRELLSIYMDEYIPLEKMGLFDQDELIRKLMQQMTSVYKLEVAEVGKNPDLSEVITNVIYKDQCMYIKFKRIAPVKLKRLRTGMTQTELAERTGYKLVTIERCELPYCDMSKQPEEMLMKFAAVLSCEEEELL